MLSGMARASKQFGLRLAGGDTARNPQKNGRVALNLMVLGGNRREGLQSAAAGAKPGDGIYVTGILGRAQLGLELLMRRKGARGQNRKLLAAHYYPALPLDLALWLGRNHLPSAMMDISDGLSTDMIRLCRASRVGARIYADRILAATVPESPRHPPKLNPLTLALHGGEDYGLLFTVRRKMISRIPGVFSGTRITRIGETVRGSGVKLITSNGEPTTLVPKGWDHFATR